jgi:uncharacterized membrane protein
MLRKGLFWTALLVVLFPAVACAEGNLPLDNSLAETAKNALLDSAAFLRSLYEQNKGITLTALLAMLVLGAAAFLFSALRKLLLLGLLFFAAVVLYKTFIH